MQLDATLQVTVWDAHDMDSSGMTVTAAATAAKVAAAWGTDKKSLVERDWIAEASIAPTLPRVTVWYIMLCFFLFVLL